jgi:hypothetical protein
MVTKAIVFMGFFPSGRRGGGDSERNFLGLYMFVRNQTSINDNFKKIQKSKLDI